MNAAPMRYLDDAPLRAVQFIDANEGWAVGDDGVILHTIDAGKRWERQPSGVGASLQAVHFVTPYIGWVVGREQISATISIGIVLATADGGITWSRLAANTLPGLHVVRFFDDKNGICAGDGTALYPTGVFVTDDGGSRWRPIAGPRQAGWRAGDFRNPQSGALAGAWSSLGVLNRSVAGTSENAAFGGRSIQSVKLVADGAIAVGHGGLFLTSADAIGAKWSYSTPRLQSVLPAEALADCDLQCTSVVGDDIWIAGRPGSFVLHSGDKGKTWQLHHTGQPLPLNSIHFHDAKTGWAVGEMGTILGTTDGGKSWAALRRGGMRSAAMVVSGGINSLPLDLIATLGGEEGYRLTAVMAFPADAQSAPLHHASDPQRLCEVVRQCGGAAAQSLRLSTSTASVDLKAASAGDIQSVFKNLDKATLQMLRDLVLTIRIWQPAVIIADEQNLEQSLRQAVKLAADPKIFAEQIQHLQLPAHFASRRYYLPQSSVSKGAAIEKIPMSEPLPRLGTSARDFAAELLLLLTEDSRQFASERPIVGDGIRLPIMEGTSLAPGGTARREFAVIDETEAKAFENRVKAAQTKRNLEAMARSEFSAIGGPDKIIGQLDSETKKMPPDLAGATIYSIGELLIRNGQWHLAREAFFLLLDRHPNSRHCLPAIRWLAQFASSSEARRRHELGQFVVTSDVQVKPASGSDSGTIQQTSGTDTIRRDSVTLLTDQKEARHWNQLTVALEPVMGRYGSLAMNDPPFQFCIAAARRSMADPAGARKWIDRYLADTMTPTERVTRPDPWRDAAAAEAWLTNRNSKAHRPVGNCRWTATKPFLDGKLDDECWKNGAEMTLQNTTGEPVGDFSSVSRFAYDSEFLYIAVTCKHPSKHFVPKVGKRTRDMDLSSMDRVQIMLDLDRDYQTYYRLQVDQRGALAEDCWGDASWNPSWFVAVDSSETGWTAEIAIPLAELTGEKMGFGKVWACNVIRVLPDSLIQAWSLPADQQPRPEGMGLLIFQEEKK